MRAGIDRTRNLRLTRLYYDANSYIAGAIETLPEVESHENYVDMTAKLPSETARQGREAEKRAMAVLLARWNPREAFVSTHTLLEAFDVATRRYGLSMERAIDIVVEGIDRDFSIPPAEFEMARRDRVIVSRLEARIPRPWEFARTEYRAMARGLDGRELGTISLAETLTSGAGRRSMQSGSPETFKAIRSLDPPLSHRIRDPKFEREMFLGAAELAVKHGVHATDALHVLICSGKCPVLVTSDKKLLRSFPRVTADLPHALEPTEVLKTWGRFLEPPAEEPGSTA